MLVKLKANVDILVNKNVRDLLEVAHFNQYGQILSKNSFSALNDTIMTQNKRQTLGLYPIYGTGHLIR